MNPSIEQFLRWAPRVLCLFFAAFLALFALDAFEPGQGLGPNLAAFAMHLIPTYIVIGVLAVGWRWPKAAGALLIVIGLAYALSPTSRQHLSWILAIAGPAWLTGVLFLMSPKTRLAGPSRA